MQFYFIYPFIFFFLLKKFIKINNFRIILVAIFSLSLICYYLTLLYGYNNVAFYLSPLRFWEFIFGGFIFFCENKIKKNQFVSLTSIISIFIIIFSKNLIPDFFKNLLIIFFSGTFIIFNNVQFDTSASVELTIKQHDGKGNPALLQRINRTVDTTTNSSFNNLYGASRIMTADQLNSEYKPYYTVSGNFMVWYDFAVINLKYIDKYLLCIKLNTIYNHNDENKENLLKIIIH
jgi:hypothetical protein